QLSLLARLTLPDNRRFALSRRLQVAVEAVIGNIRLPADKPFGKRFLPLQHLAKWLKPMQLFAGQIAPEFFRVRDRALIKLLVGFQRADLSLRRKFLARRKPP